MASETNTEKGDGMITIVGLGPSDENGLTLGALNVIHGPGRHFLRTKEHRTTDYFYKHNIPFISFDEVYESSETFEEIYNTIVERLLEEEKKGDLNYYVPGNPFIAEKTVTLLLEKRPESVVVPGMSFIEPMLSVVQRDPVEGLKIIDGDAFHPTDFDIHTDVIVTQVYNERILSECKVVISEKYGDEHEVYLISDAGILGQQQVNHIPAYLLDRDLKVGYQTSIYVPKVARESNRKDWTDLVKVTEALRGENGCPWDMEQTHEFIATDLIEESYEAVYALRHGTLDDFIEELGDVLFQVFFHSQIAYEEGEFQLEDVLTHITEKLVYRHPHVFAGKKATPGQWDELKYGKKNFNTFTERLTDVVGLPALLRTGKVIDKVTKIGFQWDDVKGIMDKVWEEYREVDEAIGERDNEEHLQEELGDLLFTCTNLCCYLGYDAEDVLQRATDKFIRRFGRMEELAHHRGLEFETLGLEGLDALWDEVKQIP